jgi:hypothetical protein
MMDQEDLKNYILLCKRQDFKLIKNISNDISSEPIHLSKIYNVQQNEIDGLKKMINQKHQYRDDILEHIYVNYHVAKIMSGGGMVESILNKIKPMLKENIQPLIKPIIDPLLLKLKGDIKTMIGPVINPLLDKIKGDMKNMVGPIINPLLDKMKGDMKKMVGPIINPLLEKAKGDIKKMIDPLLKQLKKDITSQFFKGDVYNNFMTKIMAEFSKGEIGKKFNTLIETLFTGESLKKKFTEILNEKLKDGIVKKTLSELIKEELKKDDSLEKIKKELAEIKKSIGASSKGASKGTDTVKPNKQDGGNIQIQSGAGLLSENNNEGKCEQKCACNKNEFHYSSMSE